MVPIGEASVIIAVSSAHRKNSLEAVQYCIDTLKATVPIWKKVVFFYFQSAVISSCAGQNSRMYQLGHLSILHYALTEKDLIP